MTEIIKNLFEDNHPEEQANMQSAIAYLINGMVHLFAIFMVFSV